MIYRRRLYGFYEILERDVLGVDVYHVSYEQVQLFSSRTHQSHYLGQRATYDSWYRTSSQSRKDLTFLADEDLLPAGEKITRAPAQYVQRVKQRERIRVLSIGVPVGALESRCKTWWKAFCWESWRQCVRGRWVEWKVRRTYGLKLSSQLCALTLSFPPATSLMEVERMHALHPRRGLWLKHDSLALDYEPRSALNRCEIGLFQSLRFFP